MSEQRRVLVVDNDRDIREMLAFRLGLADYTVFTAASQAEALELLRREVIHMAVCDVRLEDDSQPGDQSGFDMARLLPDYIPYVVFTAYEDIPTLKRAIEVGAPRTVSKAEDDALPRLLEMLDHTYKTRARINVDLRIRARVDLEAAARQIEVPEEAGAPPPAAADLACILQRLFHDAAEVEVDYLLPAEQAPTLSQSGSLLLLVWPHLPANGRAAPVVVKFGSAEEVRQEERGYHAIEPYLYNRRRTSLRDTAYSRRLGGLVYDLIDNDGHDRLGVFDDVYLEYEPARTVDLLERFFAMLNPMFVNAQWEQFDLTAHYSEALRLTPQKLEAALTKLHPQRATELQLQLRGLREPQLNPLLWLRQGDGLRRFSAHTRVCLCHGDLHGRNILVDDSDGFWLIDFSRVGRSHMLRDFAELETDIKFNLLPVVDLAALLPFERALLAPARFGEPLPERGAAGSQLDKAYQVVGALRRIAAEQLQLSGDAREYYQALLFHTLNVIRLNHISDEKKEYALLAASLICQRLDAWPDWEQAARAARASAEAPTPAEPEAGRAGLGARVRGTVAFMAAGALVAAGMLFVLSRLNPSWPQQVMAMIFLGLLIIASFGIAGLVNGATVVAAVGEIVARLLGGGPKPPSAPV